MTRFALVGLLAISAAVPAGAQSADAGVKSVSLLVSPIAPSSTEARAKLDRDVNKAVANLCGDFPIDQMVACRRTAREQIHAQIADIQAAGTVRLSSR